MNPILLAFGAVLDKTFYGFDMWVFHFFGSMQNTFLTYVAKFFTTFGDEGFIIPLAIFAVVLCLFKRTRKFGVSLLFAIAIGTIVTNVLVKPMVLRLRPYNTLQGSADYWKWYIGAGSLSESDYSFPSGHTTAAFELATAMFLCFKSDKKKIAWLLPVIAVCTMGSRVYLMVHYASDVIGGMIVGIVSGVVAYFLMKLAIYLITNVKIFMWIDKIDVEKLFKKGINNKIGATAIVVVVVGLFCVGFVPSLSEGGADVQRCAYKGSDYTCYNEAKVDDEKYPAIDGKNYCKIHWKQLSGVKE